MEKKISVDQIKQLMQLLPTLYEIRRELAELLQSPQKKQHYLQPGLAWGAMYDLPIEQHIACFVVVAGLLSPIAEAAKSEDPIAKLHELDDHPDYQEWSGGEGGYFKPQQLLGALCSLLGTLDSVVLYGFYLNELVSMSFNEGNDDALLKAIRVDPMVVTCEKAAHRIGLAVVQDDRRFLRALQSALKGRTGKQARYLQKFRFLMQLMLESGMLERPAKDIRSLILDLGAYADDPNSEKNLNEQIRKFRKKET